MVGGLPKLVSLVNTIGYLRGQDNAFLDVRPSTSVQNELYENESEFEARLTVIIDKIIESGEVEYYKRRMDEYFLRARKAGSKK